MGAKELSQEWRELYLLSLSDRLTDTVRFNQLCLGFSRKNPFLVHFLQEFEFRSVRM